ncbi:MAG: DNA polymerase-2 [Limisphaerales bacterium]|jgi:DNA polymerase-2
MSQIGFVLQATYRIQSNVPVVYIYGRFDDGTTFEIRDTRQIPTFYLPREAAKKLIADVTDPTLPVLGVQAARLAATDKVDFLGQRLSKVEVGIPADAPKVRDWLHEKKVPTYEADVRFAMRYLIDRQIKGGIRIEGERTAGQGVDWCFENPHAYPAESLMQPTVLSFDIETDPRADRLLAIACYGMGVDEVVIVDQQARQMPERAIGVPSEKDALLYFCDLVKRLDPDILTGWNVIDFDLTVLQKTASRVRCNFELGRGAGNMRIRAAEGYFGSGSATIPGRLVLDGMDLVRGAFIKLDEYSLDAVAHEILGEGKTFVSRGQDKVQEILDNYAHGLEAFALYARTDARLALQIVEKLDLISLAFARSALTGMTADRVAASIASFDFLYLSELEQKRIAAPSVAHPGQNRIAQGGGAVFEPIIGIHENVWVCDFKSLYPSIIRTFNIDPLSYAQGQVTASGGVDDVLQTVDGVRFAKTPGILPSLLDKLFVERARAKAENNSVASQAIKILMNSFYGVLGTPACRFYNPHIANAITGQGRSLLHWSKVWFESRGYRVLYGDTDSVFVSSGIEDGADATKVAMNLITDFNHELTDYLASNFGVESVLELEFEKLYSRLFLAKTRSGNQGARKRYAGVKYDPNNQDEIEFVGMEVVRRDWTDLAKNVQRNLFTRLFQGEEVASYLVSVVRALRAGELDDQLIYRRGLRKGVETYIANVPPHVQAVKKAQARDRNLEAPRVVRYTMTLEGPELTDFDASAEPDREHYLEKQVKPVAIPVLEALGLDFDQVIGDDRQIGLF